MLGCALLLAHKGGMVSAGDLSRSTSVFVCKAHQEQAGANFILCIYAQCCFIFPHPCSMTYHKLICFLLYFFIIILFSQTLSHSLHPHVHQVIFKNPDSLSNAVCALLGVVSRAGQSTGEIPLQLKGSPAPAPAWQHLGGSCQWQEHLPQGNMNWTPQGR